MREPVLAEKRDADGPVARRSSMTPTGAGAATRSPRGVLLGTLSRLTKRMRSHEWLGRVGLLMLQDVDERAQRIPNVEPADTPRLALGTILNTNTRVFNPSQRFFKIINLD